MAEAVVSTILDQLASILRQQVEQEVRLVVGVDEEVNKLTSHFQAIQCVLEDAECKQVKEKAVGDWLEKLKEVSYNVEDVLDEWNTAIQKRRIMEADENASKLVRKVRSLISCYGFISRQVIRHDIAKKIQDLNKALDDIAMERNRFHFSSIPSSREVERQITTSLVDESVIHGRDDDKKVITNLLLGESSCGPTSIPTISLVGLGGIGKTTLARLVFNDHEVISHFDIRIWVCVSDPFDETRIGKAILESLKNAAPNLNEYESILKNIQESIKDKKYLLVLDDVWTEDSNKMEQLRNSLNYGSKGSRILMTTRKMNVAMVMGSTNFIEVGMLPYEKCWSLFSQVSFYGKSSKECQNLEEVGRKIVNKCKGLPLAVKTLGGLLRFKKTIEEWQSVLDSGTWEQEDVEKGIFAPLLLSYLDLPSELKRCFLYCAIFPKDYKIEKDLLIKLWMAYGYLRPKQNKDMELVGEEYFEKLEMRSFFQDFERDDDSKSIRSCKMHDMVHDLAQYLTKNELIYSVEVVVDNKEAYLLSSDSRKARHAMIMFEGEASFPPFDKNKLRSLLLATESKPMGDFYALYKFYDHYPCLRALDLSYTSIKDVSSGILRLTHLRYLDISNNYGIKEIPEAVCELCNLQTLNVSDCENLNKLPERIGQLDNLRHLINYGSFEECRYMPKGIQRLTSLRTLRKVIVSGDKTACKFECLRNLHHLGGSLHIKCSGVGVNMGEINMAELKNKIKLLVLGVELSSDVSNEEAFEDFQPSPNLEKLMLSGYHGGNRLSLNWLTSLAKLKILLLSSWSGTESLCLGKLPCLESLSIESIKSLKKVGVEFLGMESDNSLSSSSSSAVVFPKLQSLRFGSLEEWEEWDGGTCERGGEDIKIMPFLRSLAIDECPKLKTLPNYLLQSITLKELYIYNCPILKKRYRVEEAENWVKDSGIPEIRICQNFETSSPSVAANSDNTNDECSDIQLEEAGDAEAGGGKIALKHLI